MTTKKASQAPGDPRPVTPTRRGSPREARKQQCNVWLETAIVAALDVIQQRDGIPRSEQMRRAALMWCQVKGVSVPPRGRRTRHVA
jgi:hypothetical protein